MKVVLPVKTNKENSPVSPLFGHSKWFVFVDLDRDEITIERNPYEGGIVVAEWLLESGADAVITQHIGAKPFALFWQNEVECYYPGEGRILMNEAIENFKKGNLEKITPDNIEKFLRHSHR